jgi:hypothetical protein
MKNTKLSFFFELEELPEISVTSKVNLDLKKVSDFDPILSPEQAMLNFDMAEKTPGAHVAEKKNREGDSQRVQGDEKSSGLKVVLCSVCGLILAGLVVYVLFKLFKRRSTPVGKYQEMELLHDTIYVNEVSNVA